MAAISTAPAATSLACFTVLLTGEISGLDDAQKKEKGDRFNFSNLLNENANFSSLLVYLPPVRAAFPTRPTPPAGETTERQATGAFHKACHRPDNPPSEPSANSQRPAPGEPPPIESAAKGARSSGNSTQFRMGIPTSQRKPTPPPCQTPPLEGLGP